ncbi:hypothetical protein ACWEU6_36850 [Streptosporangium sandarakinum]|uniref:hypothetical protein n=1 Tax=Streptosporangium sandarakinum TaxID=1260955 RepID=UPI0036CA2BD6
MQDPAALLRLGAGLVAIVHGGGQPPAQAFGHALTIAPDLGGPGAQRAAAAIPLPSPPPVSHDPCVVVVGDRR